MELRSQRRSTGPRTSCHHAGHELKGGVSEATSGIAARVEARVIQDQKKGPITRAELSPRHQGVGSLFASRPPAPAFSFADCGPKLDGDSVR